MTLDQIIAGIEELGDQDFNTLSDRMFTMREERRARPQVEQAQAELVAELQNDHPELAPKYATHLDTVATLDQLLTKLTQWVQPTSKANAYPPIALVQHHNKAWRARRLTDKEPGTPFSGWEDVTSHFLRPEPIADGNAEDAGSDAPGLVEQPTEPAPEVDEWASGKWYGKGDTALSDGALWVSQRLHLARSSNRPGTGDVWQKLD